MQRGDRPTGGRLVEVTYTEEIVRDAVRTYVWRQGVANQKGLWIAEALMIALVIGMLWQGERGWVVGAFGVFIFLPPALIIAIWVAHYRNTVGKYRSMPSRRADFTFFDDGVQVESELGSARIPWAMFIKIWERPNYWMLITSPNQYVTLPLDTMSASDRDFVRSKVAAANSRKS
ncbi:MAG: YcxB family protein [Mesorhizobium sp.]|uniref:YcxB family protein n=1 Tax=Mesorhizobium sp. TaxID=1871066 RepID=UPI001AC793D5|nr:YcxB family protein [Mesorhizobium sp.]MBN9221304.1 YcxB family protein [Mesorhizobium sp.]